MSVNFTALPAEGRCRLADQFLRFLRGQWEAGLLNQNGTLEDGANAPPSTSAFNPARNLGDGLAGNWHTNNNNMTTQGRQLRNRIQRAHPRHELRRELAGDLPW